MMNNRYFLVSKAVSCEPPLTSSSTAATSTASGSAPRTNWTSDVPAAGPRPRRPFGGHGAAQMSAHDGRSPSRPQFREHAPLDGKTFAELAIRRALEVLDRRRSSQHMQPLCSPEVVEHLHRLSVQEPPGRQAATLQSVHLQLASAPIHPTGYDAAHGAAPQPEAIEFFGRYARDGHSAAFAGRVERRHTRWQVTSLLFA